MIGKIPSSKCKLFALTRRKIQDWEDVLPDAGVQGGAGASSASPPGEGVMSSSGPGGPATSFGAKASLGGGVSSSPGPAVLLHLLVPNHLRLPKQRKARRQKEPRSVWCIVSRISLFVDMIKTLL